jgi:Immunoglobulin I-set domain
MSGKMAGFLIKRIKPTCRFFFILPEVYPNPDFYSPIFSLTVSLLSFHRIVVIFRRFVMGQYVTIHGDVISHVNISTVQVEDGGNYQCTARNKVGEVSHSADLRIYGESRRRARGN